MDNSYQYLIQTENWFHWLYYLFNLNNWVVWQFLKVDKLKSIKLYKSSQDHLEIFFGNIRAQNEYNNNPTARQFRSAYRKLVINVNNVQQTNGGNCIPLESIDILDYSSSDSIKVINKSTTNINSDPTYLEDNLKAAESFINDHDYIVTQYFWN